MGNECARAVECLQELGSMTDFSPPTVEDRRVLETWIGAHSTPQQVAKRVRISLLVSEGMAQVVGGSRLTAIQWRKQCVAEGVNTLTKSPLGRGASLSGRTGRYERSLWLLCIRSRRMPRTGVVEEGARTKCLYYQQDLESTWAATAPGENVQAVGGSEGRREVDGCCWLVHEFIGQGGSIVCEREDADTSTGPYPTQFTYEERALWHNDR